MYDLPLEEQAAIIGILKARRDEDGAFYAPSSMSLHDQVLLNNAVAKAAKKQRKGRHADPGAEEFMRLLGGHK